jgi:hypothetical protein
LAGAAEELRSNVKAQKASVERPTARLMTSYEGKRNA